MQYLSRSIFFHLTWLLLASFHPEIASKAEISLHVNGLSAAATFSQNVFRGFQMVTKR